MMFMLKSTHANIVDGLNRQIVNQTASLKQRGKELANLDTENAALKVDVENLTERLANCTARALKAENTITEMKPDYELGKKRRAAYEADNDKRKAERAAAKAKK